MEIRSYVLLVGSPGILDFLQFSFMKVELLYAIWRIEPGSDPGDEELMDSSWSTLISSVYSTMQHLMIFGPSILPPICSSLICLIPKGLLERDLSSLDQ